MDFYYPLEMVYKAALIALTNLAALIATTAFAWRVFGQWAALCAAAAYAVGSWACNGGTAPVNCTRFNTPGAEAYARSKAAR